MVEVRPLATDAVVAVNGEVVLLERDRPPFEGQWVLPGGLVEPGETAREACVRKTMEEVGLDVIVECFVGLYDDPDRDERGNVSTAYLCSPIADGSPRPGVDARRVDTFDPADLPETGFDHAEVVTDALLE